MHINPQFVGIAKQLGKSHLHKNQAKNQRNTIQNRLAYLQKEENMAEKKINKKQNQLEMLMNIIARRQADLQWKEARRRAKEEAIAQQRQINMRRRSMNQEKIRESFLEIYSYNSETSKNLRNTQRLHESMLKSIQRESLRSNQQKATQINLSKQQGRSRISSFYKQKNDLYTSRYKQKIRMEQQQAEKEQQQATNLKNISGEVKLRLQKSTSKIEELNEEMSQLLNKSKNLSASRGLRWSQLSKHNRFSETKTDTFKETDSKLDKMIERELSLTEVEISNI